MLYSGGTLLSQNSLIDAAIEKKAFLETDSSPLPASRIYRG